MSAEDFRSKLFFSPEDLRHNKYKWTRRWGWVIQGGVCVWGGVVSHETPWECFPKTGAYDWKPWAYFDHNYPQYRLSMRLILRTGLPGPLSGDPMLFLLSLVGDGGAGFPICKQKKPKTINGTSFIDDRRVSDPSVPCYRAQKSTADGLSEQNQAITLALLHTGLSIKAACITLARSGDEGGSFGRNCSSGRRSARCHCPWRMPYVNRDQISRKSRGMFTLLSVNYSSISCWQWNERLNL